MNVHVFDTSKELYQTVSQKIKNQILSHPNMLLGLATGETMIPLYSELKSILEAKELLNIHTINLDEYVGLDRDHSQSFYHFMKTHFFDPFKIKTSNIHFFNGRETITKEIDKMNDFLSNTAIQTQLLGIGSNGHIGFNEPYSDFNGRTHCIQLNHQTRSDNSRFFKTIDDVPTHAITLGIQDIMNAEHIILIAVGNKKADAVYQMIHGPIHTLLPASILQNHPSVNIYLDKEAAKKLSDI